MTKITYLSIYFDTLWEIQNKWPIYAKNVFFCDTFIHFFNQNHRFRKGGFSDISDLNVINMKQDLNHSRN